MFGRGVIAVVRKRAKSEVERLLWQGEGKIIEILTFITMKLAKDINNLLMDVADAKDGTDYYCIDCGEKMILKNKNPQLRKRAIYFSHKGNCTGSLESYLHKAAKSIIEQEKMIVLPRLGSINAKEVIVEKYSEGIKPDIIVIDTFDRRIFIEIYVTHKTTNEKIQKIKAKGVQAFEIDLSDLSYDSPTEKIKSAVIQEIYRKTELNPPTETEVKNNTNFIAGLIAVVSSVFLLRMLHWVKQKQKQRGVRRSKY